MESQGLTKEDDVIVISDDDQNVRSKSQHRGIKSFNSCDKVVEPNPVTLLPFYDLTRITYIYKKKKTKFRKKERKELVCDGSCQENKTDRSEQIQINTSNKQLEEHRCSTPTTEGLQNPEEKLQNMARRKQTQKKQTVPASPNPSSEHETVHNQNSDVSLETSTCMSPALRSQSRVSRKSDTLSRNDVNMASSDTKQEKPTHVVVRVKVEPKSGLEARMCSTTTSESIQREHSSSVQHVKIKLEPPSNETSSASGSCAAGGGATMDLGSRLQHSLNGAPTTVLTWSQLMEPKNLPRTYETAAGLTRVAVNKETSEPDHVPISTQTATLDLTSYQGNPRAHEERTTLAGYSQGDASVTSLFSFPKANRGSSMPSISVSAPPNRFSSNSENAAKMRANENGGAAGNILDLSKRSLPAEIRRVLASKYGISKRSEESHSQAMVPNFSKSRSRFTMAPRKVPGFEGEANDQKEEPESPPPSMVLKRNVNRGDLGENHSPPSMAYSRHAVEPSKPIIPEIKLPEQAGSAGSVSPLVLENRKSTTASPSPQTQYLMLDQQPAKDASEHLKNQGLLDLGSHYGELLRETSPNVTARSSSRSPRVEESANSSPAPPPGEAMIELGSVGQWSGERRAPPNRKPGESMIDLSSMEKKPVPPRSPSYRTVTFPNQNYRPNYLSVQNYKAGSIKNRAFRRNSAPGVRPPSDRSHSPQFRTSSATMINLNSFGKNNDFPDMASSRVSERVARPPRVPSGGGNRVEKRTRVSVGSEEEVVKRPCTERSNNEGSEMSKGVVGVKPVNIGNLLQLEQEEQKYIQDLSIVQVQVTGVRFKMQQIQRELRGLQDSETEIKRNIDIVRAKRVGILKDAQDREGSGGTRESSTQGIPRDNNNEDRMRQGGVFSERRVTYARGSPGFSNGARGELSDGYSGGMETKRKVELVDTVKEGEQEMGRELEKSKTKRVVVLSNPSGISGSKQGGHFLSSPHVVPSDLVLYSAGGTSDNGVSQLRNGQHSRQYPIKSNRKFEDLDSGESSVKIPGYVENFEIRDECVGAEDQVGTILVRQGRLPRTHHASKESSSVIVEEVHLEAEHTVKEPGTDVYSLSNGSKQFLGSREISSTTEEPLVKDDEGHKEILAEKERELLANKMSCEQERISSISSTVLNLDDVKGDDTAVDSLSEMEFVGHNNAVCFVLPYKGKLYSASADRSAKAFDLKTGECMTTFQGHQEAVNCLQISFEGGNKDRLFTGSNDQTVRVYNAKSGLCSRKFSFRGRVMCLHIAFGKVFVGLSSGFVAVIDLKTNKCIDQFNCHEPSRISCLSSGAEGQRQLLCTGSFDSTITIRDQCSGLLLKTITDHKLTVLCMKIVENILFSGSADTVVQSHNINTGQLVRSYTGHSMSVSGLQVLGGVLVTSSLDRIIRCFDIKTGDLLQLYGGNSDMIFSLAVCSDMIYTGCRDGKLSGIKLDLRKYHCCKWGDCSLKFGLLNHLKQHVQDHVNQTITFDSCLWRDCSHKFLRRNQLDAIQAAMEHIISHVSDSET